MPRAELSYLTIAVAAHVRASMARQTPPVTQLDLERVTGIPQSTLSRLLIPRQPMLVDQLDLICGALDVDPALLLDSARQVVAEHQAGRRGRGETRPEQRSAASPD